MAKIKDCKGELVFTVEKPAKCNNMKGQMINAKTYINKF